MSQMLSIRNCKCRFAYNLNKTFSILRMAWEFYENCHKIKKVKCNDQCTIVSSDDNIITFWGTRNGIPETQVSSCIVQSENIPPIGKNTDMDLETGNNTAAFTNFLASVYKSEIILKPIDILALFSSKEQFDKGYYVIINNLYPLQHSVLILVDTTTPLISSIEEMSK